MVQSCIQGFCGKYGESFFPITLEIVSEKFKSSNSTPSEIRGTLLVMTQFINNLNSNFVNKFKEQLVALIKDQLFTHDTHLRKAVFLCLKAVIDKIPSQTVLEQIVLILFEDLKKLDEESEKYELYLHIFEELCNSKSQRILAYLVPLLFETPVATYQLEIVTNNAEVIGKEVFRMFKNRSGLEILLDEASSYLDDQKKTD